VCDGDVRGREERDARVRVGVGVRVRVEARLEEEVTQDCALRLALVLT